MKYMRMLLLIASCAGASCGGEAQEGTVAQNATPEVCTEVYQPVCGTDRNGKRVTYSNACFARAAQAGNVSPGECPK